MTPKWMIDAYETGRRAYAAGTINRSLLQHIQGDRTASNWVKWWRRGWSDAEQETR